MRAAAALTSLYVVTACYLLLATFPASKQLLIMKWAFLVGNSMRAQLFDSELLRSLREQGVLGWADATVWEFLDSNGM